MVSGRLPPSKHVGSQRTGADFRLYFLPMARRDPLLDLGLAALYGLGAEEPRR
jgi:hypothetical protein